MNKDARLKRDVATQLGVDPAIDASHVGICVGHGFVMLTGCLTGLAEMDAIERAMERVQGLKAIAMDFDLQAEPAGKLQWD